MLLIFDLDGTLFEGHGVTIPAVERAFAEFGLAPPSVEDIMRPIGTSAFDYETELKALCDGVDGDAVLAAVARLELELIRGEESALYEGALDLLTQLKDEGHFIATSTNAPSDYFHAILDTHALRPLIDFPYCKGDGHGSKSAMVATAMKKCAERPAVVVGDRRDDVDAAHTNGALAIGAAYGYGAEGELEEADATILTLASLPYFLP